MKNILIFITILMIVSCGTPNGKQSEQATTIADVVVSDIAEMEVDAVSEATHSTPK